MDPAMVDIFTVFIDTASLFADGELGSIHR